MLGFRLPLALLLAPCLIACAHQQDSNAPFPVADPAAVGIDTPALHALIERARETRTDALVIVKDGQLLTEYYQDQSGGMPIEGMSTTKSVLGLAVGRMLQDGHISSIEQPVGDFFPNWAHGASVNIRQLLQHTSGICGAPTTEAIYRSDDFVAHALAAGLCSTPGEEFFYNNNATNLLAGLVEHATGMPLDVYLRETLFGELGIEQFEWSRDRAGNAHGMAGLQIHAVDLARIGQLMLDEGRWKNRQLVPKIWVSALTAPGPVDPWAGMLWWRVPAWDLRRFDDGLFERWRNAGVDAQFIERLAPLRGRAVARAELVHTMSDLLGEDWRQQVRSELGARGFPIGLPHRGPAAGFEANGYLGQYLVVIPDARLVAVRQIRHTSHQHDDHSFEDFRAMVLALGGITPAPDNLPRNEENES